MNSSDRPAKKIRLSTSTAYDNIPDIETVRQKNDLRLQGRFQAIFDKYSCDFTGVGDEIDLETGEVVVDNGHLSGMRHERDTGTSRRRVPSASMQRNIQYDHDELTSPAATPHPKQNVYESRNQTTLNDYIATAISANQTPFDPYDPLSVAELGKRIALHITRLLQERMPPQLPTSLESLTSGPSQQVMTPPVSEPDLTSPRSVHLHTEKSKRPKSVRLSLPDQFESIWAGPERDMSLSPAPATLSEVPVPSIRRSSQAPSVEEEDAIQDLGYQSRQSNPRWFKWTKEDDEKLLRLKQNASLTWDGIASKFHGRNSNGVQQHYRIIQLSRKEAVPEPKSLMHSTTTTIMTSPILESNKYRNRLTEQYPTRKSDSEAAAAKTRTRNSSRMIITEPRLETATSEACSTIAKGTPHVPKQTFLHVLIPSSTAQESRKPITKRSKEVVQLTNSPLIELSPRASVHERNPILTDKTNHPSKAVEDLGSDDELG